jgi:hypothetical protein
MDPRPELSPPAVSRERLDAMGREIERIVDAAPAHRPLAL